MLNALHGTKIPQKYKNGGITWKMGGVILARRGEPIIPTQTRDRTCHHKTATRPRIFLGIGLIPSGHYRAFGLLPLSEKSLAALFPQRDVIQHNVYCVSDKKGTDQTLSDKERYGIPCA